MKFIPLLFLLTSCSATATGEKDYCMAECEECKNVTLICRQHGGEMKSETVED